MDNRALTLAALLPLAALGACAWSRPRLLSLDPLRNQRELYSAGRYDAVIRQLGDSAIQKIPRRNRGLAYELLGQSYERLGEIDRALRVYQLAEGLFPKDINILTNLAELLHSIDLDEQALPYYERVIKIHPNNAIANLGLAEIAHSQGLLSDSVSHYEKVLKEISKDPKVWRDYAEVLAERQDFKRATDAIERSIKLADNNVDSLLDLALFERRQNMRQQASARIEQAIRLAPSRVDLRQRLALWRLEDGRLEDALRIASEILRGSPDDPLSLWIRASVSLRRGSMPAARDDLEKAAAQRTEPFIAKVSASMLRELRSAERGSD